MKQPNGMEIVDEAAHLLNEEFENWKTSLRLPEANVEMFAALKKSNFLEKIEIYDQQAYGMARYLRNYMKQFECILRHVRASRQEIWSLHLSAQEELTKYFFAHDHLNYAKMQTIETTEHVAWKALESGDFCVNKSDTPFCAIGQDLGIEQENMSMKVFGGVMGINQNESTLDKFFFEAPELSRLVNEYGRHNGVAFTDQTKIHHDLKGTTRSVIFTNTVKMRESILARGNPFNEKDEISNMVTRSVMPEAVKEGIIKRDTIGQTLLYDFVQ